MSSDSGNITSSALSPVKDWMRVWFDNKCIIRGGGEGSKTFTCSS